MWKRGLAAAAVLYAGSLAWRSVNPQPRAPRVRFTEVAPTPSTTPERLQVFERIAKDYDRFVARSEAGAVQVHRKYLMKFAKGKGPPSTARGRKQREWSLCHWCCAEHARLIACFACSVLEVGVGTGRNFAFYPTTGIVESIDAIDNSPAMLDQARAKYEQLTNPQPLPLPSTAAAPTTTNNTASAAGTVAASAGSPIAPLPAPLPLPLALPRVTFSLMDAQSLGGFASGSFDTVVDTLGLCSYAEPGEVLKEMARVARPARSRPGGGSGGGAGASGNREGRILLLEHGRLSGSEFTELGLVSKIMQWAQSSRATKHCQAWGCNLDRDIEAIVEQSELNLKIIEKKSCHQGRVLMYVLAVPPANEMEEKNKETADKRTTLTSSNTRPAAS